MAYCVLSGKLLDMVGKPLAKATFKFTSSSNSTSIINAVDTVIATDSNGLYYSNLAYGTYTISFRGATDANYKVIAKNIVIGVLGPITIERLIGNDAEVLPSALQDLWTESQANDRGLWTGLGVTRFFEDGFIFTAADQTAVELQTGKLYSWTGSFPKAVAKGTAPTSDNRFVVAQGVNLALKLSQIMTNMSELYALSGFVSVKAHGAIGDGVAHTLEEWVASGKYASLAAIQADYPHVTSLAQTIDWAAIQSAIATGRSVWTPKGDYWISNEIEMVTPGQVIEFEGTGGYGYTDDGDARRYWRPNTRWIAYGNGFTSDARIRTRRNHRGSAADPQDSALSVVLNIQAEGVRLTRPCVWLNCDYSYDTPTNLGDNCDIGIFVGCRTGVAIIDPQVIGYFRVSGIHFDVTHDNDLPRHLDKKGVPYLDTKGTNVSGADGCSIYNPYIIGARRGLVVAGSKPAVGYDWYGPAYYDEQLGTTVTDSRGSFGFSDFCCIIGRVFGPDHHSNYRLADPTPSGGTLNETSLNAENEMMPCAIYIDGMAGNASHSVWGMRFIGTRISTFEAFRMRLGRAARIHLIGCHEEGRNGGRFNTFGVGINTNDYTLNSYGGISGTSATSRVVLDGSVRTSPAEAYPHYYGTAISAHIDYGEAWYESYQPSRKGADLDMRIDDEAMYRWRFGNITGTTLSKNALTFTSGVYPFGVDIEAQAGDMRLIAPTTTVTSTVGDTNLSAAIGQAIRIREDNTTIATVLATGITSCGTGTIIKPVDDNTVPFGTGAARGTTIYLGTAPNVTSDERHKANIRPIDDSALDAWGTVNYYQYELVDGTSGRKHTGCIVQRIIEAFESAGLDALAYGLCCHESWDAKPATYETLPASVDEDGNVVTPERTVLLDPAMEAGGIWTLRYDEVYAFEAAYQRRRADRIEARIAALEVQ